MTTFKDFVSVAFPAEKRPLEPMLGFLHRFVSLRFSWLLHEMPVSANAITGLQMVLMAIATYLIGSSYLLFGVVLLHVGYVLDCTDGEIARFRKTQSIAGAFLDKYSHTIFLPALIAVVGYALSKQLSAAFADLIIILSLMASFAAMTPARRLVSSMFEQFTKRQHTPQYNKSYYGSETTLNSDESPAENFEKPSLRVKIKNTAIWNKVFWPLIMQVHRHVSSIWLVSFVLLLPYQTLMAYVWGMYCITLIAREAAFASFVVFSSHLERKINSIE